MVEIEQLRHFKKICSKTQGKSINIYRAHNKKRMYQKNVPLQPQNRFVAQLVEQLTLNQWVQGSTPCRPT